MSSANPHFVRFYVIIIIIIIIIIMIIIMSLFSLLLVDLSVTSVCVSDLTWQPNDLKVDLSQT